MNDTPTQSKNRNRPLIIVLVVLGVLMACLVAMVVAGLTGYAIGRSAARDAAPAPVAERVERVPRQEIEPMPMPEGAPMIGGWSLVVEVVEDSPAERAGLRVGDIITQVNGDALDEGESLADVIGALEPGDRVELGVLRNGRERTIGVTLDSHPEDEGAPRLGIYYRQMSGGPGMDLEFPSQRNRDVPWSSQ